MTREPLHPVLLSVVAIVLVGFRASPAAAQDRPFLFSVTTPQESPGRSLRVEYEAGAGERAFQSGQGSQPEQRIALQASYGRWTWIGRVAVIAQDRTSRSSQSGEVLFALRAHSAGAFTIAAGGGLLHEPGGVNVLLARLVGGREQLRWRLHGNVVMQRPFSEGRDAVDVMTTAGWARRLTPAVALGIEALAEDLEGFWDPAEAEGGARIFTGPSLHVAPAGRRWQLTLAGGPVFHPARTGLSSGALRDLPATSRTLSYALRGGLTYRLF